MLYFLLRIAPRWRDTKFGLRGGITAGETKDGVLPIIGIEIVVITK